MKSMALLIFTMLSIQAFGDAICENSMGGHVNVISITPTSTQYWFYDPSGLFTGMTTRRPQNFHMFNCQKLSEKSSKDTGTKAAEIQNNNVIVESDGAGASS